MTINTGFIKSCLRKCIDDFVIYSLVSPKLKSHKILDPRMYRFQTQAYMIEVIKVVFHQCLSPCVAEYSL